MKYIFLIVLLCCLPSLVSGDEIERTCITPDGKVYQENNGFIITTSVMTNKSNFSDYIKVLDNSSEVIKAGSVEGLDGTTVYIGFKFKNISNKPISEINIFVVIYDKNRNPIHDTVEQVYLKFECGPNSIGGYPLKHGYVDVAFTFIVGLPYDDISFDWYISEIKFASEIYLLHNAATHGQTQTIEQLLSSGFDVNAVDDNSKTPLHLAVENEQENAVKLLCSKGADVHAKDSNGDTALHIAALGGHVNIIKILLSAGADINARDSVNNTPLHLAASKGFRNVVELLCSRGANVNAINSQGDTPLHEAAFYGHVEVVKVLLAHNADKKITNKKWEDGSGGETPYALAASEGHEEVADLLRESPKVIGYAIDHEIAATNIEEMMTKAGYKCEVLIEDYDYNELPDIIVESCLDKDGLKAYEPDDTDMAMPVVSEWDAKGVLRALTNAIGTITSETKWKSDLVFIPYMPPYFYVSSTSDCRKCQKFIESGATEQKITSCIISAWDILLVDD